MSQTDNIKKLISSIKEQQNEIASQLGRPDYSMLKATVKPVFRLKAALAAILLGAGLLSFFITHPASMPESYLTGFVSSTALSTDNNLFEQDAQIVENIVPADWFETTHFAFEDQSDNL